MTAPTVGARGTRLALRRLGRGRRVLSSQSACAHSRSERPLTSHGHRHYHPITITAATAATVTITVAIIVTFIITSQPPRKLGCLAGQLSRSGPVFRRHL